MKSLGLEKHIENASCKDGALYIINEYLQARLVDASKIVRMLIFMLSVLRQGIVNFV